MEQTSTLLDPYSSQLLAGRVELHLLNHLLEPKYLPEVKSDVAR